MADLGKILSAAAVDFEGSLGRLFELLRIPSIGTDPHYHVACQEAAEWLAAALRAMAFEVSLRQTSGRPVVVAKRWPPDGAARPHVLFYGHYDVQPADPLELWDSPPFEPRIAKNAKGEDAIFARGACDDKGQLMTFLEAVRVWLKVHGDLPFRLTVLIEGDEEGDTTHLDRFLAANRKEFACDTAFICDTELWMECQPAIITMLRGCISDEVTVHGPRRDLHSGDYGGAAVNPIKALARILAAIHDKTGRVAIPGFYDGVKPLSAVQREQWRTLKFPVKRFLGDVGLSQPAGEAGYSPLEQMWARPTAEFNGIYGGYRGIGAKTIIPADATAKLSFRLVEGQDPRRVRKAFRAFVRSKLPADCKATFRDGGGDSSGIRVAGDTPWINAASAALKDEWGKAPVLLGGGFSIPVVESFKTHLNVDSLLVGFSKEADGAHSPNEKYDVDSYYKGIRSWARIFAQLA